MAISSLFPISVTCLQQILSHAKFPTALSLRDIQTKHLKSLKEKEKEGAISSALLKVEQLSLELNQKAQAQYNLEIERIKKFSLAWNDYFHALRERYPHYKPVQDALGVVDELNNQDGKDAKATFEKIESRIVKENEKFDPKLKIRDYIAATEDNGFNLDEVLNPGELQLEEICKELGLLGGED